MLLLGDWSKLESLVSKSPIRSSDVDLGPVDKSKCKSSDPGIFSLPGKEITYTFGLGIPGAAGLDSGMDAT